MSRLVIAVANPGDIRWRADYLTNTFNPRLKCLTAPDTCEPGPEEADTIRQAGGQTNPSPKSWRVIFRPEDHN